MWPIRLSHPRFWMGVLIVRTWARGRGMEILPFRKSGATIQGEGGSHDEFLRTASFFKESRCYDWSDGRGCPCLWVWVG